MELVVIIKAVVIGVSVGLFGAKEESGGKKTVTAERGVQRRSQTRQLLNGMCAQFKLKW